MIRSPCASRIAGGAPAAVLAVLGALAVSVLSGAAAADPITVRVIDIAGDAVYVSPGRAAGIVPGTVLRLSGIEVPVIEVTENTAVVRIQGRIGGRIDGARIALGDTGAADVTPGVASAVPALARPRPAEAFTAQWNAPVLPASQQIPASVPLGAARGPGDAHITVTGHAYGAVARPHSEGDAEGRVIARFDAIADRPLGVDLDLAGRWFSTGYDARTRTPVFVRAAQLRYGDLDDPRLAVGRLRFAATSVGMLDGGRASARIGSIELAAFGGLVPDSLSGKPDTSASRFGTEIAYDAPDAPWQPRISLAAHGSTWNGALDERRLSLAASADHGPWWLDGWADVDLFAAGNPWGARAVELGGGGASVQWRSHGSHAGIDVTFLRPERSLRLAAALPPEWLCTLSLRAAAVETCASGDWWGSATASLGTRTARWSVDGGATLGDSHGQYRGQDRSGYARGELRLGPSRLWAGLAGGQASFASWTAGELGAAYAPTRALDLALGYRPELLDYVASTGPQLVHAVIADARFALSSALDLALSATGTTGADRDALALVAMFAWRPMP